MDGRNGISMLHNRELRMNRGKFWHLILAFNFISTSWPSNAISILQVTSYLLIGKDVVRTNMSHKYESNTQKHTTIE